MTLGERLARFREIVSAPESSISLAEAALVIAAGEYPDLDIAFYLRLLDAMADAVRHRLGPDDGAAAKIDVLNRYLFAELRFRGNTEHYYDPRNSYLSDVLDRRVGLPITLSVVYIEVGRRLGWPLVGVGLPGHFVVKWQSDSTEIFVDPFHAGQVLDRGRLLALVRDTYHPDADLRPEWVQGVGPHYILIRMLNNLREIFVQNGDSAHALEVMEKLLILEPHSEDNLRVAGLLCYRAGAYRRAAEILEEYLLMHPEAKDAARVRVYLRTIWVALARMN